MERNIRRYIACRFFRGLLIMGPTIASFWLAKGLNYSQIMTLQSIFSVAIVVFEMPTGTVADMIFRKHSLCFPGLCIGVPLHLFILFSSFYIWALAKTWAGLGLTFRSGVDSGLLYEKQKKLNRQSAYAQVEVESGRVWPVDDLSGSGDHHDRRYAGTDVAETGEIASGSSGQNMSLSISYFTLPLYSARYTLHSVLRL